MGLMACSQGNHCGLEFHLEMHRCRLFSSVRAVELQIDLVKFKMPLAHGDSQKKSTTSIDGASMAVGSSELPTESLFRPSGP